MDELQPVPTLTKPTFEARALYVAERIDLRSLLRVARTPVQLPVIVPLSEGGLAMLFRYGAVVFFDASAASPAATFFPLPSTRPAA
jgi:hypothetical protein